MFLIPGLFAQQPEQEVQDFQNVQVSQYMKSETLINVAIIIFIVLVIVIVATVLAKTLVDRSRAQKKKATDQKKDEEEVEIVPQRNSQAQGSRQPPDFRRRKNIIGIVHEVSNEEDDSQDHDEEYK